MATPMRRSDTPLDDLLFQEPYRFDFFQAVRLLERIHADRRPVGHDASPRQEVVRFVAHLGLSFPASAIHTLERRASTDGTERPAASMSTPFMGLIGPSSVLPTIYTETLVHMPTRLRAPALDFFDMFHHRLVSLFYRAWEKYNIPALWEQGLAQGQGRVGRDRFSRHLFDLIGLGLDSLHDRQAIPDESLLYYSGFFAQQHRSVIALELLLRDHFEIPARVVPFTGQWLRLQPDQQSRMGTRNGAYNALGVEAVVGHKVWDDQSKFRVCIGPLPFEKFRDVLPGGQISASLTDLVRFYVRSELEFDVQVILKADEVPFGRLSRDPRVASQLGRYSWLKRREFEKDPEDVVFRPRTSAAAHE